FLNTSIAAGVRGTGRESDELTRMPTQRGYTGTLGAIGRHLHRRSGHPVVDLLIVELHAQTGAHLQAQVRCDRDVSLIIPAVEIGPQEDAVLHVMGRRSNY